MKIQKILLLSTFLTSTAWIAPFIAHGATYYVSKTGSNNYSCTQVQSASTPKLTIAAGLACMAGGDTLIIKAGTYAEGIDNDIPAGTSASNRTKIIGLNGTRWTLRPSNVSQCEYTAAIRIIDKNFIEIADLVLDGTNCTGSGALVVWSGTSHDNILRDSEIKNAPNGTGILFQGGTTSRITLSRVTSHNHGNDALDHCIYPSGSDHVLEYVEGYNCSGHGLHMYAMADGLNNRNIIKWSSFHNNGSYGIGIYRGSNNQVFGNILVNNGTQTARTGGIRLSGDTTKVYNNTIYSHGNSGHCVRVETSANGSIVRNNLCLSNSDNTISDEGTTTVTSHNRLSTDATLVVDASKGDFRPRAYSALIDAGTAIAIPSGIAYVGAAPDQGAIEAPTAPSTQASAIPKAPISLQVTP